MGEEEIGEMFEVYRDGVATKLLFLSEENARLWILNQADDACYSIRPYNPE